MKNARYELELEFYRNRSAILKILFHVGLINCCFFRPDFHYTFYSLFSSTLLEKHKSSLTQLIARDKNHPSVIAWSIANEPRTQTKAAGEYFGKVANHTRKLDPRRPITLAVARGVSEDQSVSIEKHHKKTMFYAFKLIRDNIWISSALIATMRGTVTRDI